jgi:hypothetical protein
MAEDRKLPVIVLTALQSLIFFGAAVMWLAWAGWGVFPNPLILSSIVFGPFVVASGLSAFGLWRGKRFGWILGLAVNGILGVVTLATVHPVELGLIPWLVVGVFCVRVLRQPYIDPRACY